MEQLERLQITQAILAGLVLTGIYYMLMFDDGKKITSQINKASKSYKEKIVIKEKIKKALDDKQRFEREAEQINNNLEAFLQYFPADTDRNLLMKEVSKAAENQQVTVLKLLPIDQAPEFPNYPEVAFEFEVEGTYHAMMRFISELTQLKRAIDFRKTKVLISKQGENPVLKFTATMAVFGRKPGRGQ